MTHNCVESNRTKSQQPFPKAPSLRVLPQLVRQALQLCSLTRCCRNLPFNPDLPTVLFSLGGLWGQVLDVGYIKLSCRTLHCVQCIEQGTDHQRPTGASFSMNPILQSRLFFLPGTTSRTYSLPASNPTATNNVQAGCPLGFGEQGSLAGRRWKLPTTCE